MGILVVNPGHHTTLQDQGRAGRREFGVPAGGAFDRESLGLANALVGNEAVLPALEFTLLGGDYRALNDLPLAIAGAPMVAEIVKSDGSRSRLTVPQSFTLARDELLRVGGTRAGARAYLAVGGGWNWEGRRPGEKPLHAGLRLDAETGRIAGRHPVGGSFSDPTATPIRLIDGPDAGVPAELMGPSYAVGSSSNRVGLRLDGPTIRGIELPDRLSAPTAPGAVQVAGGKVLLLGIAGGTMGGYPHVAHTIDADLDRVGQLRPGDRIRFERVDLATARAIDRKCRARQGEMRHWLRVGAQVRRAD